MIGAQARISQIAKEKAEEEKSQSRCLRQAFRAELYALAVLVGQGMVVVYVIGTLLVNCLRT